MPYQEYMDFNGIMVWAVVLIEWLIFTREELHLEDVLPLDDRVAVSFTLLLAFRKEFCLTEQLLT